MPCYIRSLCDEADIVKKWLIRELFFIFLLLNKVFDYCHDVLNTITICNFLLLCTFEHIQYSCIYFSSSIGPKPCLLVDIFHILSLCCVTKVEWTGWFSFLVIFFHFFYDPIFSSAVFPSFLFFSMSSCFCLSLFYPTRFAK